MKKQTGINITITKIISVIVVLIGLVIVGRTILLSTPENLPIDPSEGSSDFIGEDRYDFVHSSVKQWGIDTDLAAANASFIGENGYDYSGYYIAGAGDVNADGVDDFLIGAWGDDDGGTEAGQTYLILGRPTADWQMDLDLSQADASFIGEDTGDQSGRFVAGVGDVNADGFDDFLIGAPYNADGGGATGQTYLILGRPTANWQMDLDLSQANASFIGEDAGDHSGTSVAGVGDVNADGVDDLLIGAPYNTDGGDDAGQTYLILGRPTADWKMNLVLSQANASFIGEDTGDQSGRSVAGVGDVNADGFDDLLIGALSDDDGGTEAGQTYLILGRPTAEWQMNLDLSQANASFIGENGYDNSGDSVAGVGDVNADGFDDFLIGAWGNNDGGTMAGQTYLILGRPTAEWQMNLDLSQADASFIGEDTGDRSGRSVAGAGDVNNDSFDDILIGADGDDDGGAEAGQTYLILGRPKTDWQMDLDLSAANASFIGEDADDYSGRSVAGVGDVNADGVDDLLIGALGNDDGGTTAGQTYLILGKDVLPPTIEITSPTNLIYNQNSVTLSYSISEHLKSLVIYLDGLANTTALPSGSVVTTLSDGIHNITFVALDHFNNVGKANVIFTVDTTPPTIDHPADIRYVEEDILVGSITWNPSDPHPASYSVTMNDTPLESGVWDGGSITVTFEKLASGNYTVVCTVSDQAGNSVSDSVVVSVLKKSLQTPWPPLILSLGAIGFAVVLQQSMRKCQR